MPTNANDSEHKHGRTQIANRGPLASQKGEEIFDPAQLGRTSGTVLQTIFVAPSECADVYVEASIPKFPDMTSELLVKYHCAHVALIRLIRLQEDFSWSAEKLCSC